MPCQTVGGFRRDSGKLNPAPSMRMRWPQEQRHCENTVFFRTEREPKFTRQLLIRARAPQRLEVVRLRKSVIVTGVHKAITLKNPSRSAKSEMCSGNRQGNRLILLAEASPPSVALYPKAAQAHPEQLRRDLAEIRFWSGVLFAFTAPGVRSGPLDILSSEVSQRLLERVTAVTAPPQASAATRSSPTRSVVDTSKRTAREKASDGPSPYSRVESDQALP